MNVFRRVWLALTNPTVDDEKSRESWWREMVGGLQDQVAQLQRDQAVTERRKDSNEAAAAWRASGRLRRMLKMAAAQTCGAEIGIVPRGDQRIDAVLEAFVQDPLNCLAGFMVQGAEGFLLRVIGMYLAALRDGDLFVTLNPRGDGTSVIRTRPRAEIAYVATDPHDWERELWYAERQEEEPLPEARADRSQWKTTWDAPGEATLGQPEMFHFTTDRLDGSTQGESLATAIQPWVEKYEELLRARVALNQSLAKLTWIVDMPGADVPTRATRKAQLMAQEWGYGSFVCQNSEAEKWEPVAASPNGQGAEPDLDAVLRHVYVLCGIVPFWAGELMPSRTGAARAVTPVALASLRVDQKLYFGFLAALLSRMVEKWAAKNTVRMRPWSVRVTAADTTSYETLESARALNEGAQAIEKALAIGMDPELAQSLLRQFAGLPEEAGQEAGVRRITLSSGVNVRAWLSDRSRRAEARVSQHLGQVLAQTEDAFQKELRELWEGAAQQLLAEIEKVSTRYDGASEREQAELLVSLAALNPPGETPYRAALVSWLSRVYAAARELVGKNGAMPPWAGGWVEATATNLAAVHFAQLKASAVGAALRELTTGEVPRARAAAEGAARERMASNLRGWDDAARDFVLRLSEEGVLL